MITKLLGTAAIVLGAAVGAAAPALADPINNNIYGCACQAPTPKAPAPSADQMTQAVQKALSDLQASQ